MKYYKNIMLRLIVAIIFVSLYEYFYKTIYLLTIHPAYFFIKLAYPANLMNNAIFVGNNMINIIPACIAGIAYSLLLFLILFTKGITLKKSLKMFFIGAGLILAMNILRIDLLIWILIEFGPDLFNKIHLIFWNFVSAGYVAIIWIYLVKKFKIRKIPIISDIKELYKRIDS
jgi:exosortase/archaeosortase family protein